MAVLEKEALEREPSIEELSEYWEFPPEHREALNAQKKQYLAEFAKKRIPGHDKTALVYGRFQPLHAGHLYIIEAAAQVADEIVIGIGSAGERSRINPLSTAYRQEVLEAALKKKNLLHRVRFIHLEDLHNPSIWTERTLKQAGPIDVVVGGLGTNLFEGHVHAVLHPEKLGDRGRDIRMDMRGRNILRGVQQPVAAKG